MRILHVIPSYLPAYRFGGPISSTHNLNKYLVKNGVDVTVFTTNINKPSGVTDVPLSKEVVIDGVKVWYFPITLRQWEYSHKMHVALRERMKDFDVVHITSVFLSASALGAHYAMKYGKPYIISPRGNFMQSTFRRKSFKKTLYTNLVEKRALKNASIIHFTTEKEKEDYFEKNLPAKRSLVMPNIIESAEGIKGGVMRRKLGIPERAKIVLFAGRFNKLKGFDTLIPAFAKVINKVPDAVLVLMGEGEDGYEKEIVSMVHKFKMENRVLFTGFLSGNDKSAMYMDSDVFVLPSYSENFGMAVTEAMSFGVPVIISENVAIGNDIKNGRAGIVIEKSISEFSKAMIDLLCDDRKRADIGARGRSFVIQNYGSENIVKAFRGVYNEIIEQNSMG